MEHNTERRKERQMVLTEADILAISAQVERLHVCRYDLEPKDFDDLMDFVRGVRDARDETRKVFRTAIIRILVYGTVFGTLTLLEVRFQWIRPILRLLTGTPG